MPDFDALLNAEVTSVERPPNPPSGSWNVLIKAYKDIVSDKKKTPGIEFEIGLVSPCADVDKEEFEEYSQTEDHTQRKFRYTFWLTEKAMIMLREFLEKLDVNITGKTFKQALPETVGKMCIAYLAHTPSDRPGDKTIFANITAFTKPEED